MPLDDQYREFIGRDQFGSGISPDQRMRTAKINDRPVRRKPWLVTRMFRGLVRFSIAILIGVGGTLGWQNYGDQARDLVMAWNPSLGPLLPPSPTQTPSTTDTTAAAGDLGQQIKLISLDVAIIRRDIEQIGANQGALAAKADQMAQSIAALQQAGLDTKQRMASPTPAAPAAHVAPRRPPPAPLQTSAAPPPPASLADPPER